MSIVFTGCGCSFIEPKEQDDSGNSVAESGDEEDDHTEPEAEPEPEPEAEEANKGAYWVVEPMDEYSDIGEIAVEFGIYASEENREQYLQYYTCKKSYIGYPQQWNDGIIMDEKTFEAIGSIKYDVGVISVKKGDGEDARWGIMDYDGNIRRDCDIDSPITGGPLITLQGIGYLDTSNSVEGRPSRYHILSGDYSRIEFSGYQPTGVGLHMYSYYFCDGVLKRYDVGSRATEDADITDELKNSLIVINNEGEDRFYNTDGYMYINETGDTIQQDGRFLRNFVNGYYVAIEPNDELYGLPSDEYHKAIEASPKCIIKASTGERITDCIYESALYFEEGYCPVKRDGKWGFINESGEEVTDIVFDKVSSLYDGKVAVVYDGKFGIICFGDETEINREAISKLLENN